MLSSIGLSAHQLLDWSSLRLDELISAMSRPPKIILDSSDFPALLGKGTGELYKGDSIISPRLPQHLGKQTNHQ